MHIVCTEQSMRGWIVCGSPGVLLCSTGCCLSLICLTTVCCCPQICSIASCFALGTDLQGIRRIVFLLAMALLAMSSPPGAEVETQPQPPKKCNAHLQWKRALTIALLRAAKRASTRRRGLEGWLCAPWQRPHCLHINRIFSFFFFNLRVFIKE